MTNETKEQSGHVKAAKQIVRRLKGRLSDQEIAVTVLAMFHSNNWVSAQLAVGSGYVGYCLHKAKKHVGELSELRKALRQRSKRILPAWE